MKGYRTLVANGIAAGPILVDLIMAFAAEGGGDLIPKEYLPYYTLILVFANVYLRMITTTPVGKKE